MDFHLDTLLNLPNITVFTCRHKLDCIILQLELLNEGIICPHCQEDTDDINQNRPILVRDLSIFGQAVYLQFPRRQFYCSGCQKYSTEQLCWMEMGRKYTQRYEEYIYEKVKELTVEQVSRTEQISAAQVERIFHRISRRKKKDWGNPERLSLDEFSRCKGQRKFATVVSDVDRGCLLEVVDSHQSEEIIAVLKQQPLEVREQVKEVSVDMWGGFKRVITEVFPNAVIVIDRFHVMKLVNQSLNKIRLLLGLRGLKNRSLLLKNGKDLSQEEQVELENILSQSVVLSIAYELKEEFREIYETSTTVAQGLQKMKKWLGYAQILFGETSETIRRHLKDICNYFISRTTSGVMEGINNKIKLILRQGYGFSNFEHLREKLLACLFDYKNS
jgi:transposase